LEIYLTYEVFYEPIFTFNFRQNSFSEIKNETPLESLKEQTSDSLSEKIIGFEREFCLCEEKFKNSLTKILQEKSLRSLEKTNYFSVNY